MKAPPLTWLYVPADRPDRVEKALDSRAHAVIVDLEDAVAPTSKAAARAALSSLLGEPRDRLVFVRVNAAGTPWSAGDLAAVAGLDGVTGVVLPKVETAPAGAGGKPLHCLIETSAGVEAALEIARAPGVLGISLGEADLSAETGADGVGLDWARSRIVNAACAAGLPRPPQSVYPHVRDADGLRESCLHGQALGHLGRTAIHPAQLPVIEAVYLPSVADVERARDVAAGLESAAAGAYAAADGSFVDAAFARIAQQTLALAGAYGTRDG